MSQPPRDQEPRLLANQRSSSSRPHSESHSLHDDDFDYDSDTICNSEQNDVHTRQRTAGVRGQQTSHLKDVSGPDHNDFDSADDSDVLDAIELDDMDPQARRPGYKRGGKSGTPLLYNADADADEERGIGQSYHGRKPATSMADDGGPHYQPPTMQDQRPSLSRRSTMRSHSARRAAASKSTRQRYTYAAFFLTISLISFCVQTELSAHIQHDLGWDKAYCMMFFTHSSWVVLFPVQLMILRLQQRDTPWPLFWRRHKQILKTTAIMVETRTLDIVGASIQNKARPLRYMMRVTAFVTSALTIAGLSWYIAVSLTTPSDLTAIYNCSAFFAYVFSVPLLKEPLRADKSVAVLIAIVGVLVVAYGDTGTVPDGDIEKPPGNHDPSSGSRFVGNLVIGVGSILYGLYEVLYKRFACPPDGVSPDRGMIFANTFGACIGLFTLTVLWIPLPILHWLGIEKFELPVASTCWLILCAVLANATFSGSFLVLISLTSPVLSSVAALLTIFIVAIADWFITGQPLSFAAIIGGSMIIVAFLALSWSTYREMTEHEVEKVEVDFANSDNEGDISDRERQNFGDGR